MLGRVSVLFVLFLLIVPSDAAHPQHHRPGGITSRVGAGDVFAFIPGITKADVCSTCVRVLTAVKAQAAGSIQQGTSFVNSFVTQGCAQLTGALSPLALSTLGPFCREAGGRLMAFLGSGAQIPLSYINPQLDCQVATFC